MGPTTPVPYVKQIHFFMSFIGLAVPVLDNLITSAKVEFVLRTENSSLPPSIVIGQEPFHECWVYNMAGTSIFIHSASQLINAGWSWAVCCVCNENYPVSARLHPSNDNIQLSAALHLKWYCLNGRWMKMKDHGWKKKSYPIAPPGGFSEVRHFQLLAQIQFQLNFILTFFCLLNSSKLQLFFFTYMNLSYI